MLQLAETACSRCREQKLKCSREIPRCARCHRLGLACSFPEPPDRKLLASNRANARKRRAEEANLESSNASKGVYNASSGASNFPRTDFAHSREVSCEEISSGIAKPLQLFLIDVYFTHMYNAWLLFHQPTFVSDIEAGKIPAHLLLSVYATSAIFLRSRSSLTNAQHKLLEPLGDIRSRGIDWAIHSGSEVLRTMDQPCFSSVQTCEVLALFWFSMGHSQRNTMFSGIAYKAACVMGLDRPSQHHNATLSDTDVSDSAWLQEEIRRRCFWATWLTNCINSEHYTTGTSVNNRILNLPLPIDDYSFRNNIRAPLISTRVTIDGKASTQAQRMEASPSIMAELVKLMMIWAALEDYLEGRQYKSTKEGLADLFDLDARLAAWSKSLHPSLVYSKRNLYKQLVVDQQPTYVFVHALHHQCCLVLHSSLVPQFSGLSLDTSVSSEVINVSARVALKHAKAISELGSDLIALDWEFSRVAPFVGYCIYVSASIYIVFLFSQNSELASLAKTNLVVNLKVLKAMKLYWSNLERLVGTISSRGILGLTGGQWARINILYEAQLSRQQPTSFDHQCTVNEGNEEATVDSIDTLVRKERDTGKLEEPLADSVLAYNLRLKQDLKFQQGQNTFDIERMVYNDPLIRVVDRENSRIRNQQQSIDPHAVSEQYSAAQYSQQDFSSRLHEDGGLSLGGSHTTGLPGFMQEDTNDWWQVNFDDLTQTMLSHNDLFNLEI